MRRKDISTKVLGEQGSRQFKTVFEQAQKVLRHRFGMEMTELPAKGNLGGLSQARGMFFVMPYLIHTPSLASFSLLRLRYSC